MQEIDKYKTGVKYSYYAILILDTVQPIVNSLTTNESYRTYQKVMEGTLSPYIILDWSGMCVISVDYGLL